MDGIKYFPNNINIEEKSIILRLDLNVPVKNSKIQDFTRINLALPLLKDLINRKAKIIIITHLGRPDEAKKDNFTLVPIYKYLKEKIKTNIYFFMGQINEDTKDKFSYLKKGEIVLIENIRFNKGENDNDDKFAKILASLGEIYINDAFSCSHRKQASIHKITKYMKFSFAGPQIKKEVTAIDLILKDKKKPVTCIIGGSKVSTKINIIFNLIKNVNNIIIVGAMANNFLLYRGINIGKSLIEKNSEKLIKEIFNKAEKHKCKIIVPEDYKISKNFDGKATIRKGNEIHNDDIILDIGPASSKNIENIIDVSKTILWNGPAGYFENLNFGEGTISIAKKISENTQKKSLISILGGGDTISAINKINKELFFTHLSTAGGAFLEYLEGKDLPGLSVLK